jgi:hypothetical protein
MRKEVFTEVAVSSGGAPVGLGGASVKLRRASGWGLCRRTRLGHGEDAPHLGRYKQRNKESEERNQRGNKQKETCARFCSKHICNLAKIRGVGNCGNCGPRRVRVLSVGPRAKREKGGKQKTI